MPGGHRATPHTFAARLAVLGGIALAPSVGFAQAQHDGHALAGTPPAAAALGAVHFPVTCNPAAQEAFDRGMLLQHSFWFQAAGEAFRAARQADPGCTMTHWGEALSLLTNPFSQPIAANLRQGRALLDEAKRLGARDEREAAYVEALSLVFAGDDMGQHRARLGAYRDAMARLHQRYLSSPWSSGWRPRRPTRPTPTSSAGARSWSANGGASRTIPGSCTT